MLADIADVKAKLELAEADDSRDDALELVLEAATAKTLSLTRYSELDEESRQDTFKNVRIGVEMTLSRRPVTDVVVEYRWLGSDQWVEAVSDVTDANEGTVLIVGAESFPPSTRPSGSWREVRYDVVRVTYGVFGVCSGDAAPADLRDATAALAAYWYDLHTAGAASSLNIGLLSKTLRGEAVPPWYMAALGDHASGGGGGALLVV